MATTERDSTSARRLPAGPAGRWKPTLKLVRDPRGAMESWVQKYGDPFLLNALNGSVVVTGREDLIRTIHSQDPSLYAPFAMPTIVPLIGSGSMLVLEGEAHRRERRLMMPMFHGDRMKAYGETISQLTDQQIEAVRGQAQIKTLELMTNISLETIVRTIFGGDQPERVAELIDASRKIVSASSPLLFFSRKTHISCLGLSPWDRWNAAKKHLLGLLDEVVVQRQKSSQHHDDILSLLCGATYEDGEAITRDHIHAELMTILFAGHETTALTLTWGVYHLLKHPEVLAKLRQKLDALPDDSPAQLTAAPYLKATVQETLRLHPILTEVLRKLNAPLQLGEYLVPAGYAVAPATILAHYNPQTYPDPDTFRPERFLERSFSPFQYMPFGGGHRRCIGAAFASYELAIVLGTLCRRYEFKLLDARPVVPKRRSVTMGPSTSVPIQIIARRDGLVARSQTEDRA
jgi:cytochrome P450